MLGESPRAVLANASGALPLLRCAMAQQPELAKAQSQLPAVYGVRGQVSWAMHAPQDPPAFPACRPMARQPDLHVPWQDGQAWFVGASYQPDTMAEWPPESTMGERGMGRGAAAALGQALASRFESVALQAWHGTRCTTADRLPLVGPLNHEPGASLLLRRHGFTRIELLGTVRRAAGGALVRRAAAAEASLASALDARRRAASAAAEPSVAV